jgi:hypothetical protein
LFTRKISEAVPREETGGCRDTAEVFWSEDHRGLGYPLVPGSVPSGTWTGGTN